VFVGGRIEREYTGAEIAKDAILQAAFNGEPASNDSARAEPLVNQS
jgi:simple sugar transport system ATP-binding protein